MYLVSREWASSSPSVPALLCVAPDVGQENQLIKAALQRLAHLPTRFTVYTTTAQLLLTRGVLGPIWRQVEGQESQSTLLSSAEQTARRLLFPEIELGDAL